MKAPEKIEANRLLLYRPGREDIQAIYDRYASDPEVTRYLAWPRHQTVSDTESFLNFSDSEWNRAFVGPYLVRLRGDQTLLGSTGLALESPDVASTGYVFARDTWGRGYASEALRAMIDLAKDMGVSRLYALCHCEHAPSARVLEKAKFTRETRLPARVHFPNLGTNEPCDVFCYALNPQSR